jgi:RimJ/RimL family protein N-acetyltransferase
MKPNLNEEIRRIKSLMIENVSDFDMYINGEISSPNGLQIILKNKSGEKIGNTNVIDFKHAVDLSRDFKSFLENKKHPFQDNNCVYQFGTEIDKKFRRNGYATILRNKCHDLSKENNFKYATGILRKDNTANQNLMKKMGYNIFDSSDEKDFVVLEL